MKTFIAVITRALLAIVGTGFSFNISAHASTLTVTAGQTVTIEVSADGTQPFTYQWRKNGAAISGATLSTYTIAATTTSDSANYSAIVANTIDSTISDDAVLTVNPSGSTTVVTGPTITTQPVSLSATAGQAASFSVSASSTAKLTYQWLKNGTAISGATTSTYAIAATTATDAALYAVIVSNSASSVKSSAAVLTINIDLGLVELTPRSFSTRGENAPNEGIAQLFDGQITTKWLDFSATSWVQITLTAPASLQAYGLTSANDMPERDPVSWTLLGSNDGVTWTLIETRSAQTWSNRYLVRDFILAAPSGVYTQFRFEFRATSGTSIQLAELELFGLTGASLPAAPVITNQPTALAVTTGQSATFAVTATNTATLAYQWLKNGSAITGATNSTYTIAATTTADSANYSVIISNFASSVTSASVALTINPALTVPAIITQPTSLTVTTGTPASLSVTASGSATLTYQWMKNGAVILGATNSAYTITATTTADAASYSVFVANSAGSVTSNNATLTVNAAPSVQDLTPQSYSAHGQLSITTAIANLFDHQPATTWVDASASTWVKVVFTSPTELEAYSLTSANDAPECDPASWTLSGSNDGTNWTVIETRSAESWATRLLTRDFILATPSGAFTQFRFNFKVASGSITQLADLELFGHSVVSINLAPTTYSARGQASTSQGVARLFDNKTNTKWLDFSGTSWVKIVLSSPALLRRYTLTSAADTSSYDPASWTLSGSNDDINWTVIDTRTSQSWSSRRLTRDFVFTAPATSFSRYRFDFRGKSGSAIQLSELKLYGDPAP